MGETCANCRFWERWLHTQTVGTCKRYPSQWTGRDDCVITDIAREHGKRPTEVWGGWTQPVMSERGWCGEFLDAGREP